MKKEKSERDNLPHFICIDDDPINNIICGRIIKANIPLADVQTFTDPEKGLHFLKANYAAYPAGEAVLFLDINMPSLSGWDVLERFNNFSSSTKERIRIFMLSSSVSESEILRAKRNVLVSGFISKPLSRDVLHSVLPIYA